MARTYQSPLFTAALLFSALLQVASAPLPKPVAMGQSQSIADEASNSASIPVFTVAASSVAAVAVLVIVVGAVVVRRRTRIQSAIVRSTSNNPNFQMPRIELGNKNEV
ncbi:hypothetical protein HDU99_004685, partial [Rhizoclosmatium hyalinum]